MITIVGYAVLAFLAVCLAGAGYALGRGFPGGRGLGTGLGRGFEGARERAFEALGAGMIVIGARGRVLGSNAEARFLLGLQGAVDSYRIQSALREIPQLSALLVAGEGSSELDLGEGASYRRIEARAFTFGGPARAFSFGGSRGNAARSRSAVLLLNDVTESAALLAELSALASQDSLTGIYNRRRFDELGGRDLELARRSSKSIGAVMIDLDLFKRVNDEHGHAVGDQMLKATCEACKDVLRSTDVFARYGGEEFAAFLPDSGEEDSLAVAERLRSRIEAIALPCEGGRVSITASLGVYSGVPRQGEDLALYLRRADEALYRSKALGRNRVSYWEPIRQGGA